MDTSADILYFGAGGGIEAVYSDSLPELLEGLGAAATRRASHVEPAEGGGWEADLSPRGGPVLGPYPRRAEALEAELAWLARELERSTR